MGNFISKQRKLNDILFNLVGYIGTDLLHAPGLPYDLIHWIYGAYFDSHLRQKVLYDVGEVVDHENPKIVGRNRRAAHAFLRSFKSTEECLAYWSDSNRTDSTLQSVFYLTGEAGMPLNDGSWKFLLVGSPKESPEGWELPTFSTEIKSSKQKDIDANNWNTIALPGHWQLQNYDVPLYSNTVYPFAFDPPRYIHSSSHVLTINSYLFTQRAIESISYGRNYRISCH